MSDTLGENTPTNLDELVTGVATRLMGVDSTSLSSASDEVLKLLVEHFGVDLSFLRFHDNVRRESHLVAEFPPRTSVPDPDPLGVVPFEGADPAFGGSEHLTEIMVVRPDAESEEFQERVRAGAGPASSVAVVPMRSAGTTTGVLGFVKYGDRGWAPDELRALRTIAVLLAQMQARLVSDDQLRHLAHHDELTGLPNRRALLTHLQSILDAGDEPHALLFLDVDRLKAMNDFLGHEAGDHFIVEVAERLRATLPPDGVVARLGGDEFVVSVPVVTDGSEAAELASRIQRAVAEPMRIGGQTLGRTVSIGIAMADSHAPTVSEWLRNADQAVLAAKEHGGGAVVTFTTEMAAQDKLRVAVEMNLIGAIRTGLLTVHFQPMIDLRTRAMVGAEALLRWNDPVLGPVSPELFVGVAEATNLAGELGEWVLDEACRRLAAWRDALAPDAPAAGFSISVNVSPVQLIAIDFVDTVATALATHGLEGSDLILEITEHAVLGDLAAALTTLRGLRELGVAVAIDDFGTGYSSLAQLKELPVTILKIDRGFVRDLDTHADDQAIVRSIVGLAESFGLDLVAEGVETEDAAEVLMAMGCSTAQGHLFSPAVPSDEILDRLRAGPARTEKDPSRRPDAEPRGRRRPVLQGAARRSVRRPEGSSSSSGAA